MQVIRLESRLDKSRGRPCHTHTGPSKEHETDRMHALDWLNKRGLILCGAIQPI